MLDFRILNAGNPGHVSRSQRKRHRRRMLGPPPWRGGAAPHRFVYCCSHWGYCAALHRVGPQRRRVERGVCTSHLLPRRRARSERPHGFRYRRCCSRADGRVASCCDPILRNDRPQRCRASSKGAAPRKQQPFATRPHRLPALVPQPVCRTASAHLRLQKTASSPTSHATE